MNSAKKQNGKRWLPAVLVALSLTISACAGSGTAVTSGGETAAETEETAAEEPAAMEVTEIADPKGYAEGDADEKRPDFSGVDDAQNDYWATVRTPNEYLAELPEKIEVRTIDLSNFSKITYANTDGTYVAVVSGNENSGYVLSLLDTEKDTVTELYAEDRKGFAIHNPLITPEGVYWTVATENPGDDGILWSMSFWSFSDETVSEIRNVTVDEGQLYDPNASQGGDSIFWIELVPADGGYFYRVFRMNAALFEPELLFTFHYMSSPYIRPLYANGYLSVVDYYGGAWQVLWYEVSSGKLFSLPITGLLDKDFPVAAVTDGKTVAILTEFERMYVCDPAAGTMEFAANVGFNVQLLGDYLLYVDDGMCCYQISTKKNYLFAQEKDLSFMPGITADGETVFTTAKNSDRTGEWLYAANLK